MQDPRGGTPQSESPQTSRSGRTRSVRIILDNEEGGAALQPASSQSPSTPSPSSLKSSVFSPTLAQRASTLSPSSAPSSPKSRFKRGSRAAKDRGNEDITIRRVVVWEHNENDHGRGAYSVLQGISSSSNKVRFMSTVLRPVANRMSLGPGSPLAGSPALRDPVTGALLSEIPFQIAVVSTFGAAVDDATASAGNNSSMSMASPTNNEKGANTNAVFTLDAMAPADRLSAPSALLDLRLPLRIPLYIPFCTAAARAAYGGFLVYTESQAHFGPDGLGNCGFFGLGDIDLETLRTLTLSNNGTWSEETKEMKTKVVVCAIRQLIRRRFQIRDKIKAEREELRRLEKLARIRQAEEIAQAEEAMQAALEEASGGKDNRLGSRRPKPISRPGESESDLDIDEDEEEFSEPLSEEEVIGEVVRLILIQSLVAFHPEQVHKVGKQVAKLLLKKSVDAKAEAATSKRDDMNSYTFPVGDHGGTIGGDMSPLLNQTGGRGVFGSSFTPGPTVGGNGSSSFFFGVLPFAVPDPEALAVSRVASAIDTALQDVYNVYQRLPRLYEAELVFKKDLRTRLLVYTAMKYEDMKSKYDATKVDQLIAKYEGLDNKLEATIYEAYGPPTHPIDLFSDWMTLVSEEYTRAGRRRSTAVPRGDAPASVSSPFLLGRMFSNVVNSLSREKAAGVSPSSPFSAGSARQRRKAGEHDEGALLEALASRSRGSAGEGSPREGDKEADYNSDLDILDENVSQRLSAADRNSIGGEQRGSKAGVGGAITSAQRIARRITPQQLRMHAIASSAVDTYARLAAEQAEREAAAERSRREWEKANLKNLFDDFENQYANEEYQNLLQSLGLHPSEMHPSEKHDVTQMAADGIGGAGHPSTSRGQTPVPRGVAKKPPVIDANDFALL